MEKLLILMKEYKITRKELGRQGLSSDYLGKIIRGERVLQEKHLSILLKALNDSLKERKIEKRVVKKDLQVGLLEDLEKYINESIIDKSIYTKEKQRKIEKIGQNNEVYSKKYRYIVGRLEQKNKNYDMALLRYYDLLKNFKTPEYFYSILIEVTRIEKPVYLERIYKKYRAKIKKAPQGVKSLLYYNFGMAFLKTKKYKKGIECFKEGLNLGKERKYYYKSYNGLAICYQKLGMYNNALEIFLKLTLNPLDFNELKDYYTNLLSCGVEMKDEILVRNTLKKLEIIIKGIKEKNLYKTYKVIGNTYLYLKEDKKAIEIFERLTNFPYGEEISVFYLNGIEELVKLYSLNSTKQREIIAKISKIPSRDISYNLALRLLKYYTNYSLEEEAIFLIKNLKL